MRTSETHPLIIGDSGPPGIEVKWFDFTVAPPYQFEVALHCNNGFGVLDLLNAARGETIVIRDTFGEVAFSDIMIVKVECDLHGNVYFDGVATKIEKIMPTCTPELPFDLLELMNKGVSVRTGRHHDGLAGFYATFANDNRGLFTWEMCGHGFTVQEALIEAKQIFDGDIRSSRRRSSEFVPPCDIVHQWFGLSYAQYLTVPRSVLQSMPEDWQQRFVDCLNELDEAIDWPPKNGTYRVQLMTTRQNYEEGGFVETVWDKELEDPLMDYERGRRRIPRKAA